MGARYHLLQCLLVLGCVVDPLLFKQFAECDFLYRLLENVVLADQSPILHDIRSHLGTPVCRKDFSDLQEVFEYQFTGKRVDEADLLLLSFALLQLIFEFDLLDSVLDVFGN